MKRNEYIRDRKNQEIEFLKQELEIIRAEREKHDAQVIVAEVVLFLMSRNQPSRPSTHRAA